MRMAKRNLLVLALGGVVLGACGADTPEPSAGPGSPPVGRDRAIEGWAKHLGISYREARTQLAIQRRAAPMFDPLRAVLDEHFAQFWFDVEDRGRVKVGIVEALDPAKLTRLREIVAEHGLLADTDFVPVRSTWRALTRQHEVLSRRIWSLYGKGQTASSVDPSINAIVIRVASDLTRRQRAMVAAAATRASVTVKVRAVEDDDLRGRADRAGSRRRGRTSLATRRLRRMGRHGRKSRAW